ncbi:MAG: alpha/beta hydrolase, partial [Deltaproteobacteria bacterium]|nr:alpha/beta hydrolase [Deltaproteobacteria bacterium]
MRVTGPKDKWLEVNGFKLHYLEWGNQGNPPILLLHGFLGHAHVWDEFAVKIIDDYHVLALDQRGHGQSQKAKDEAYSLDDHFTDLSAFSELLELDKLILVGHSMGGRNALFFTACLPERVKKLVLVDARPAMNRRSTKALKDILDRNKPSYSTMEEILLESQEAYPY